MINTRAPDGANKSDIWKTVEGELLLWEEWFEDVEGEGERLDGRRAWPHYHAPAQKMILFGSLW